MTRFVNIEGIDDHVMERRPIVTAGATVRSNRGPVILIMNQYAHAGKGHTIHSSPQMEHYGLSIDEKSRKVGGLQRIATNDGFVFAVNIRQRLPETPLLFPLFNEQGALCPHVLVQQHAVHTLPLEDDDSTAILMEGKCDINESTNRCVYYSNLHRMVPLDQPDIKVSSSKDAGGDSLPSYVQVHKVHLVTLMKLDYYKALCSQFAWLPADIIQKTFGSTTQNYNTVL